MSEAEALAFARSGWSGPHQLFDEATARRLVAHLDRAVLCSPSAAGGHPQKSRYLDDPLTAAICTDPRIVAKARSILGGSLMLWRSRYWDKPPGGHAIGWHQDGADWPIEPMANVTAWVALTDTTEENGALEVFATREPGYLPHIRTPRPDLMFNNRIPKECLPQGVGTRLLELKAGQFVLFDETALHRSGPNRSLGRRLALAVRITRPDVLVRHDAIFAEHGCVTLAGQESTVNRLVQPPNGGRNVLDVLEDYETETGR
ncbi:phytanoyl-CoA dioxygenase family protein [Azospirillum agricola]|uniref:phytanoyl-CoA dioxygenase family protein n=1 Tax=Azospirillum agricola TaxID=1720247 RepID=UPI0015C4DEAC|nr:phytanoyl-CoA dioxygenase family protein [Azospirillum agricola]